MGTKDTITKKYMQDNAVFADAFNYLFENELVKADSLSELGETEIAVAYLDKGKGQPIQKFRDVLKKMTIKQDGKAIYVILGIENQTDIHYAMPVRNMLYDALNYSDQITEIKKEHLQKKEFKSKSHGEFLSGLWKNDKLMPLITLVVYFGAKPWDGPRSLHEMLLFPNEELKSKVADYRIEILEASQMTDEDLKRFRTSLREIMTIVKYSSDSAQMWKALQENEKFRHIDSASRAMIELLTGKNLKIEENEKGETDMCKAFEDMILEGKEAGIREGKEAGKIEGERLAILQNIRSLMETMKLTASQAMDALKITKEQQSQYLQLLETV